MVYTELAPRRQQFHVKFRLSTSLQWILKKREKKSNTSINQSESHASLVSLSGE